MKNNQMNKRVMEQKITSFFVVFCLIISNFFYVKPIYALDVNQLLANVVNWAKDVSEAVEKYGGGVLKASLSTALNEFAKTLATNTVNSIANGGAGQEPLYFNFSLEDSVTAAVDNAVGSFLDNLVKKDGSKLDLCKPIGTVDVNWKFKLMLNIIPDLNTSNTTTTSTKYNCTLSKFVDNVKTSITNITTSIQKTFAKDCFSEFETSDLCGLANSLTSTLTAFDINSLKNVYGYDSSPVFCKEATYYLKSGATASNFAKAASSITTNSLCGTTISIGTVNGSLGGISSSLIDSNVWTTNASDCLKRNALSVFDVSKLASSVFNTSDGTCLVSFKYCKFDSNGSPIFDKAKQKKFISQYNNCYRAKVKEALGSLIEVGPALPTDKLIAQEINSKCDSMSSSFFSDTSQPSIPLVSRALLSETDNKFAFFITRKMSPAVFAGYVSAGNVFNDGETVSATTSTDEKENFPFLTKIVVYTAKSWTDFQNQIGKSNSSESSSISKTTAGYDVLYFNDGSGTEYFYYHNNGKLNKINLISSSEYSEKYSSGSYSTKKEYMTTMCTNLNSENAKAYIAAEEAQDNEKMASVEAEAEAEKAAAKENATKEYPVSGSFKSVTESISKQITTPSEAVQKQFETSLEVGTNALQPTGDLFIDPIKIFLTTLLSESSNTLLRGLFDTVMPAVEEPEVSDFDANEYVTNEAEKQNTCNNSSDSSKFPNYTPCGANYQCQSCCCTTGSSSNTGIMYCLPLEYCE